LFTALSRLFTSPSASYIHPPPIQLTHPPPYILIYILTGLAKLRPAGRLYMHRKGGSGEGRGVSLIFEAIRDYCRETPIFLYPALGNLNIKSPGPHWPGYLVISRGSLVPQTGKVAVYLVWQP